MKAAVILHYGSPDGIDIRELPPPEPAANEVLVRVRATTVSRTDVGLLRAQPFLVRLLLGLWRPKITTLGLDFAGEVAATGADVTRFRVGDHVFGLSSDHYGAHAELLCLRETAAIAHMPRGLSFHEALVGEGVWYATSALDAAAVEAGHRVLIYGASGAIGTAALQLAKLRGAEVTAVLAGPERQLAQDLGADAVVDYTAEDFTQTRGPFDFVFDAVGKTSYFHCSKLLGPSGIYGASDLGRYWQNPFLTGWFALTGRRRVIFSLPGNPVAAVRTLTEMLEQGSVRAVIDRVYPLEDIRDAYRYVETERKVGIVVIDMS